MKNLKGLAKQYPGIFGFEVVKEDEKYSISLTDDYNCAPGDARGKGSPYPVPLKNYKGFDESALGKLIDEKVPALEQDHELQAAALEAVKAYSSGGCGVNVSVVANDIRVLDVLQKDEALLEKKENDPTRFNQRIVQVLRQFAIQHKT